MSGFFDNKQISIDPVAESMRPVRDALAQALMRRFTAAAPLSYNNPYASLGLQSPLTQLYGTQGRDAADKTKLQSGPQNISSGSRSAFSYTPSYVNQYNGGTAKIGDGEAGGDNGNGNGEAGNGGNPPPYEPPVYRPDSGPMDFNMDRFNLPMYPGPMAAPLTGMQLDALSGFQQMSPTAPILQTQDIKSSLQKALGGLPAFDPTKGQTLSSAIAPFQAPTQAGGYFNYLFGGGSPGSFQPGPFQPGQQLTPFTPNQQQNTQTQTNQQQNQQQNQNTQPQPSPRSPTPVVSEPGSFGPLEGHTGTLLSGAPVPLNANPQNPGYQPVTPNVPNLDPRIAALIGQAGSAENALTRGDYLPQLSSLFGIPDYQIARGGIPGWGPTGNEMNATVLNTSLLPQGYLAGVGQRTPGSPSLLSLYQPGGTNVGSFNAMDALTNFLQQRGVQFRAAGGEIDPNAYTVVGEQGPEIIPPGGNQVIPMNGMNLGGGATLHGPGTGQFGGPSMPFNPGGVQDVFGNRNIGKAQSAFGQALDAPSFDQTEMFQRGQQAFNSDLDRAMARVNEESSAFGLNPGASDRTDRALRTAGELSNQFRIQQLQQGQQAFEDAQNRKMNALALASQQTLGAGNLGENARQFNYGQLPLVGPQAGLINAQAADIPARTALQGQQIQSNERSAALPYMLQQENLPWERMFQTNEASANRQMQLLGMMPQLLQAPFDIFQQQYGLGQQAQQSADTEIQRAMQMFLQQQGGGLNQLLAALSGIPLNNTAVGNSPFGSLMSALGGIGAGLGAFKG